MSRKQNLEDKTSDVTSKSENDFATEIMNDASPTSPKEFFEISDNTADSFSVDNNSYLDEERSPVEHLLPKDLLSLQGRHIKAEDFKWGVCPVLSLADIIIETSSNIESSQLEKFLEYATGKQKHRIYELLPLDLPLNITLEIIDDGIYWKRMCLRSWPPWDTWKYSNSWKIMFIHRSVQELIENFSPGKDSIQSLCKSIEIYSKYVTSLKITKLIKITVEKRKFDVFSNKFDEKLDDDDSSTKMDPIYLNFEKVFDYLPHIRCFIIALSPSCMDFENFHFNNTDFKSLLKGIQKFKNLEKFRLSNGNLSNKQLTKILEHFFQHKALRELNLSYNFIDDCTCNVIKKLLESNISLKNLNLMYNKITDKGAIIIASALTVDTNLKKLDLSLNVIEDEGASAIAKALLKNGSLEDLDLSKNKVTEEGGIAFAELVKESRTLRSLRLQENFLGEKAGKMFAKAVKENDYILELKVRFCGFREEDEGLIHQVILQNRFKVPYKTYKKENNDVTGSEFLF